MDSVIIYVDDIDTFGNIIKSKDLNSRMAKMYLASHATIYVGMLGDLKVYVSHDVKQGEVLMIKKHSEEVQLVERLAAQSKALPFHIYQQ